eukprot:TRINITY_DN3171_c3_g13_i1.p1 TRINITY_DN3171_c3_g13~~TRINITY_DN3171_c3_g13_i1.p1  ORF type:complete len:50 (-),score=6.77 TRINITY_DN3171_c3_g13_i1:117-266(-)
MSFDINIRINNITTNVQNFVTFSQCLNQYRKHNWVSIRNRKFQERIKEH